ncbi:MAG: TIGR00282 family metallophosphoesterase [Chloroflexota bacterium]|nr:TIGR00282 family metallophosphoesterase [Chloroflexota bacterium]
MRALLIGDIMGKPGRRALEATLPRLREEESLDLVIANGENAAGGYGLTAETADAILAAGADVITSGNHIWDQREVLSLMEAELPILRPANYPEGAPGRGMLRVGDAVVINLQGRVFMPEGTDSPWTVVDDLLAQLEDDTPKYVFVDFHTEATSEQNAMGWYLDGRVSTVVGTHTHVPTADARVLPKGTAYVTDLGMTGAVHSIIGSNPDDVLARFLTAMPRRLNVAGGSGPVQFNAVLVELDGLSGLAKQIRRVDRVTP